MSVYRAELLDAERSGLVAYEAMERWVSQPPEAHDDIPGAVLEGYARDLRESREQLLATARRSRQPRRHHGSACGERTISPQPRIIDTR